MTHDVVSSHWIIPGQGFGNLCKRSIKNILTKFPGLIYAEYLLYKHKCHPKIVMAGKTVLKKQKRLLGFDSAKQMLSLSRICETVYKDVSTVCVIGDGYGFFASLIKEFDPSINVISINIEKVQKIDKLYATSNDITYIDARDYEKLKGQNINLFVNIASMQEMNRQIIENYFKYMRASAGDPVYFYCCNRLVKELPDGEIIVFLNYPWKGNEEKIIDELCPWYQNYVSLMPPFVHKFDGAIWHRLVKLGQLSEKGDKLKINTIIDRPWGKYTRLESGGHHSIKRITVFPKNRISLQMHHQRSEHWVVVSGAAKIIIGDKEFSLRKGESTFVPIGSVHRLENPGIIPLEIIEVAIGDYLGEDDIIRFDDDYGRTNEGEQ